MRSISARHSSTEHSQSSLTLLSPPHADHVRACRLRQDHIKVGCPKCECLALLRGVGGAIVDASHASLVSADVVQARFNDVRIDAKLSHAGGDSASNVA